VGIIATDREATNYHNRVGGLDGDFKFTKKDRIKVQVLASQTEYPDSVVSEFEQPDSEFGGIAFEGLYVRNTEDYEVWAFHKRVDEDFRADMGFMTQAGYIYSELGGELKWQREADHWFNYLSLSTSGEFKTDYQDQILRRGLTTSFFYQGPMESHSHFTLHLHKQRYDNENFTLAFFDACYGFQLSSLLFAHLAVDYGDQIDYSNTRKGTRFRIRPDLTLNLGLHLKAELGHTYEQLDVSEGRLYTANISRFKMVYQINKEMFLRGIVQYVDYQKDDALYEDDENAEEKEIFSQFLFSYKINPQTVFFLGYSDNYYGDQDINTIQTNRTVFAKIGYAFVP
jgi:hypothetical protein